MIEKENESKDSEPTGWLNCKAVAEKFGCSFHTIKSWAKKGEIDAFQKGERAPYFVDPDALEKKLRQSPSVKSIFQETTEATEAPKASAPNVTPPQIESKPEQKTKTPEVVAPGQRANSPPEKKHRGRSTIPTPGGRRQERKGPGRKADYRTLLNQARRLPLGDKVRLRNEISRLIDAA